MDNYRQMSVLSQQKEFRALQTSDGHSLLFCIGDDQVFYLIREVSGTSTGWEKIDLSSKLSRFNEGTTIKVKTFEATEDLSAKTIDLLIAVEGKNGDKLYTALDVNCDISDWNELSWLEQPYDDADHPVGHLSILNINEVQSQEKEYIVVDLLPNKDDQFLKRFFLDPSKKLTGKIWNNRDLGVNVEGQGEEKVAPADILHNCMGKKAGERVAGIYTLANGPGKKVLLYTPLYNPRKPKVAVNPTRFKIPDTTSSMAVTSPGGQGSSLFITADDTIYFFAPDKQKITDEGEDPNGVAVLKNEMITNTEQLYANESSERVIVWGVNQSGTVYYAKCDKGKESEANAWSGPFPIIESVQVVSPYISQQDNGVNFFAKQSNNVLKKAVQDPTNTLWTFRNIALPAPDAKASKGKSFTTHIQVTDDSGQPLVNEELYIRLNAKSNFYINNLFFALDTQPTLIKTDNLGALHIIEWVEGLKGTGFSISKEKSERGFPIDPINCLMKKIGQLTDVEKLKKAKIKDDKGNEESLLPDSVLEDKHKVAELAEHFENLHKAWEDQKPSGTSQAKAMSFAAAAPTTESVAIDNIANAIEMAAGDMLSLISKGFSSSLKVIKAVEDDCWSFIAEIGGKIYRFLLDSGEKILDALETVWNKIVKEAKRLWRYVKFLFEWDDIVRTKDVSKQLISFYFDQVKDWLNGIEKDVDKGAKAVKSLVEYWKAHETRIPVDLKTLESFMLAWATGSGDIGKKSLDQNANHAHPLEFPAGTKGMGTRSSAKGKDDSTINSAQGKFLLNHFNTNINRSELSFDSRDLVKLIKNVLGDSIDADKIAKDIEKAIEKINVSYEEGKKDINQLISDVQHFWCDDTGNANPDWLDGIKKIFADIAIVALDLFVGVIDALFEILKLVVDIIRYALKAPLKIPVLSDILEDVAGIKMPSILDIILMVCAVPGTLVYKISHDEAPFPKDDNLTKEILNAYDYASFKDKVGKDNFANISKVGERLKLSAKMVNVVMGCASIFQGICDQAKTGLEVVSEAENGNIPAISMPIGVLGLASFSTSIFTTVLNDIELEDPSPMDYFSTVLSNVSLLEQLVFRVLPSSVASSNGAISMEPVAAGVDAVLSLVGMVPASYSLTETAMKANNDFSSNLPDILDGYSNILGNLSSIVGFAGMVSGGIPKPILIATGAAYGMIGSTLQTANGGMLLAK